MGRGVSRRRFFASADSIHDKSIVIKGEEAHYALRVLRLNPGMKIEVVDGEGRQYRCRVTSVRDGELRAEILSEGESSADPGKSVVLLQGVIKGSKMDLVVEKVTELGVSYIMPVITERSVVQLKGQKAQTRVERWYRIAISAAKQCGRASLPEITPIYNLTTEPDRVAEQLLDLCNPEGKHRDVLGVVPWERERSRRLSDVIAGKQAINDPFSVFIGPEGGLVEDEVAWARECGLLPVTLGRRILRSETAAIVTSAFVLQTLEESI